MKSQEKVSVMSVIFGAEQVSRWEAQASSVVHGLCLMSSDSLDSSTWPRQYWDLSRLLQAPQHLQRPLLEHKGS